MAFCFTCALSHPESQNEELFAIKSAGPFIDSAMGFAGKTPLEYLATFVDAFVVEPTKRRIISERIFGSYDAWLGLLGDDDSRNRLEKLTHKDARTDDTFQKIGEIGSEFARGLQYLFFNREDHDEKDDIARLSLKYIGF